MALEQPSQLRPLAVQPPRAPARDLEVAVELGEVEIGCAGLALPAIGVPRDHEPRRLVAPRDERAIERVRDVDLCVGCQLRMGLGHTATVPTAPDEPACAHPKTKAHRVGLHLRIRRLTYRRLAAPVRLATFSFRCPRARCVANAIDRGPTPSRHPRPRISLVARKVLRTHRELTFTGSPRARAGPVRARSRSRGRCRCTGPARRPSRGDPNV